MELIIYLAGEIHSDWRKELKKQVDGKDLPIKFVSPQTTHALSDDVGEKILGEQPGNYYRDDAGAAVNNFRTDILMNKADAVVAFFGEDYRQWNTAMDATTAVNQGKPLIIIRPESLIHALKELSNQAHVTVDNIEQAVQVLTYIFE